MKSEQRWLKRVKGQDEVGASGTTHIQFVALTDQVRLSALKRWLPRAHFEPLKSKLHLTRALDYVAKDETSVSNTRFDIHFREETQQVTTNQLLIALYAIWEPLTTQEREGVAYTGRPRATRDEVDGARLHTTLAQRQSNEYYWVMNEYVSENPTHSNLFGNRMIRELWTHCRPAVRDWWETDRQTRIAVEFETANSEPPV